MTSLRSVLALLVLVAATSVVALSSRLVTSDENLRVILIVAERYHFSPSEIRLRQGEQVILELTSEDTIHGFRVPAARLNVTVPSRGRGRTRIRFTAHEKGRYQFECSRACGAGHIMMRGTIVVQ